MTTHPQTRFFGRLSLFLALPALVLLIFGCSNNNSPTTGNNPTPTNTPGPVFTATPTASATSAATSTHTPTQTATSTITSTPTDSPTPTDTATITSTATVTSSPTATATTCNGILGNLSTVTAGDSTADGTVFFFRYQAPINTTLIQLTAEILYYGGADSSVQYGIYSDTAGPAPGSLLGSTSVFNTNDMGGTFYSAAVTLALTSPVAVTAGTYYWLAYDGGGQALYDDYPDASSSYFEWSSGSSSFVPLPSDVVSSGTTFTMTSQPLYDLWGSTCP